MNEVATIDTPLYAPKEQPKIQTASDAMLKMNPDAQEVL